MPKNDSAANGVYMGRHLLIYQIRIILQPVIPFTLTYRLAADDIQPDEENPFINKGEIFRAATLTLNAEGACTAEMLFKICKILFPIIPCIARIGAVIPFIIARQNECRHGQPLQPAGHIAVYGFRAAAATAFDIPYMDEEL